MIQFRSEDQAAIVKADFRDAPAEELRQLYIRRNVLGMEPDTPVYRIMELKYFLEDLQGKKLTYTKIDKHSWGDSAENPLLGRKFLDEVTGGPLTLDGVVRNAFGSCWSTTEHDSPEKWAIFSRNNPAVRVQSTPRKMLDAVMSLDNSAYMHQHAVGKVRYSKQDEIEAHFSDTDWQGHLDSNGEAITASLLWLSEELSDEDEARFLYEHFNSPWSRDKVQFVKDRVSVPFDWAKAIDAVVVGPLVPAGSEGAIRNKLHEYGISRTVTSSAARTEAG